MIRSFEELARTLGTTKTAIDERREAVKNGKFPKLIEPEGEVAELSEKFPTGKLKEITELMLETRKKLEKHELNENEAKRFYNLRTAQEILKSKKLVTCRRLGIGGCHDLSIVVLALLKHRGIKATFVRNLGNHRQPNHSYVMAEEGGEFFKIDLSSMAKRPVMEITLERMKKMLYNEPVLQGADPFDAEVNFFGEAFEEESHGSRGRG